MKSASKMQPTVHFATRPKRKWNRLKGKPRNSLEIMITVKKKTRKKKRRIIKLFFFSIWPLLRGGLLELQSKSQV